jgi:hypothetical protein
VGDRLAKAWWMQSRQNEMIRRQRLARPFHPNKHRWVFLLGSMIMTMMIKQNKTLHVVEAKVVMKWKQAFLGVIKIPLEKNVDRAYFV